VHPLLIDPSLSLLPDRSIDRTIDRSIERSIDPTAAFATPTDNTPRTVHCLLTSHGPILLQQHLLSQADSWLWKAQLNFNILWYGAGCKRRLVKLFVETHLKGPQPSLSHRHGRVALIATCLLSARL